MASSKVGQSGQTEQGHCNWCQQPLEEGKFEQYGDNYHICDACTLKFGQRASVVIESNPDLAEKVEEQIESEIHEAGSSE